MKLRVATLIVAGALALGPQAVRASTPAIDLAQHGLTGSWYEPATSGQGFEIEVFPGLGGAGMALYQVSWFTYDTVSGGADRQRWYTASGSVSSAAVSVELTIYANTGGNFNAPPITTGNAVGSATLTFDSCTSGVLTYAFTDGSGRTGSIPLTRLTQNVTCSTTSARPANADFGLSGNWYDPNTSGQGFTVEVNPTSGALFYAWYTYVPNGVGAGEAGQRWYTGLVQGIAPGTRSFPIQIRETTGGRFNVPTVPEPGTATVGNGTLTFQSCSSATFNYSFTGGASGGASGTINLGRVGPTPPGCAFTTASAEGLWRGTATSGRPITAVVFTDGTYYIAYFAANGALDGGLQGVATIAGGQLASDRGRNVALQAEFAAGSSSVSGTYTPKASLNLTIGTGATAETVTATYDASYETLASAAVVAGTYRGVSGHGELDSWPSSITIDTTGRLTVHGGCNHIGRISPHGTTGVFDLTLFNGCLPPGSPAQTGIVIYDAARAQVTGMAPLNGADMVFVFGTRQ